MSRSLYIYIYICVCVCVYVCVCVCVCVCVLVEMPLTRLKECWPLSTESLPELTLNCNIVTVILSLWPINSGLFISPLLPHLLSSFRDSLPSLNLLCQSITDTQFMPDAQNALSKRFYIYVIILIVNKCVMHILKDTCLYICICIFTNLLSTSIHGYQRKKTARNKR